MKLWAHIKGKDYPINYGATFSDELSETLDSGSITISHEGIIDIKPFDDVIIHDRGKGNCPARPTALDNSDITGTLNDRTGVFYRHLLASTITRDRVVIGKDIFNYKISLFSETKGLENVQLPNRTITNPKEGQGRGKTIWEWLLHFVGEYSPKVKVVSDKSTNKWVYTRKYRLDAQFESEFSTLAPEQQWNLPTLKDVIRSLTITKGYIPTVKDGIITFMNLTKRGNQITSIPSLSWDTWTMDASQYCDRLRKTYTNSLSKNSTTVLIEKLSFRNSGSPTMDLSNMKLEFSHPIYKIRKMKMCYLAKKKVGKFNPLTHTVTTEYHPYCIKWDITKLILTTQERNIRNPNWREMLYHTPTTIDEMAKFQLCTIGYNIGSTSISGWGERYSYPLGFWQNTKTYIENIALLLFQNVPYGSFNFTEGGIPDGTVVTLQEGSGQTKLFKSQLLGAEMLAPSSRPDWVTRIDILRALTTNLTHNLKNFFFECEYEGYVEGTVIASKDFHDGDVVKNDNQANSLSIVETEGLMTKEKVNRLGNASITKTARLNANLDGMLELGDYFKDEDEIMYKRSITVDKDHAVVNYYFCKNFILQNYFSSVFSRHRPFPLASAEESTKRSENRTLQLLLSPNNSYYSDVYNISFSGKGEVGETSLFTVISSLVSFFKTTPYDEVYGEYDKSMRLRYSLYSPNDYLKLSDSYMTDTQVFVAGTSLCVSMKMTDNITAGMSKIVEYNPYENESECWYPDNCDFFRAYGDTVGFFGGFFNEDGWGGDTITGSTQQEYFLTEDTETGFLENISFGAVSIAQNEFKDHYYESADSQREEVDDELEFIKSIYRNNDGDGILSFPKYPNFAEPIFGLNSVFHYKDGKEKIEATLQFEPVCEKGVSISSYFMQMSDICGTFVKNKDGDVRRKGFMGVSIGTNAHVLNKDVFERDVPFINLYVPSDAILQGQNPFGDVIIPFEPQGKSERDNRGVIISNIVVDGAPINGILKVKATISVTYYKNVEDGEGGVHQEEFTETRDNQELDFVKVSEENTDLLNDKFGFYEDEDEYGSPIKRPCCNTTNVYGYDCYAYVFGLPFPNDLEFAEQYGNLSFHTISGYSHLDIYYETIPYKNGFNQTVYSGKHFVKIETDGGFVVTQNGNLKYVIAPKMDEMTPNDAWEQLPSGYKVLEQETEIVYIGVIKDQDDKPILRTFFGFGSSPRWAEGSIRMYFYDDRDAKWHFVWGQDFDNPSLSSSVETICYLSLLEDRSKTVYDPVSGDPYGKVREYNSNPEVAWGVGNYCDIEN